MVCYYKVRQLFITKCDKCYYKVRQVLQSVTILLQSAKVVQRATIIKSATVQQHEGVIQD